MDWPVTAYNQGGIDVRAGIPLNGFKALSDPFSAGSQYTNSQPARNILGSPKWG
jgi:hypothetical protein